MPVGNSSKARRDETLIDDEVDRATKRTHLEDLGVRLLVVRPDKDGEELVPGAPRQRVLRHHNRGGVVDTSLRVPQYVGPTIHPITWCCSEAAEEIVLHGPSLPTRILLYGGMGAGKTTTGAQWLWFQILDLIGTPGELGITVPTHERAGAVQEQIMALWKRSWWRFLKRDRLFLTPTRHRVRIVTTTQRSKEQGSPVQGWNWMRCLSEEIQDSTSVDSDIEMRGRAAPKGIYKRLANATAKDDTDWRNWRDARLKAAPNGRQIWTKRVLTVFDNPFMEDVYREDLRHTMSEREYQRKVLAQDVASELVLYPAWSHDDNIRPIPHIGARDVTERELLRIGIRASLLIGHDPGEIWDVSSILRAYEIRDVKEPVWFIVGEVSTHRQTTEEHVAELVKVLRADFGLSRKDDLASVIVRIDPHSTNGADDDRPDLTVLRQFENAGIPIKAAAYKPQSTQPMRIQPGARVDMHNTLLKSASGKRRLCVACDHRRQPSAPRYVKAMETCQVGVTRKNEYDLTHWPCSVEYALWAIEKPRLEHAIRSA